ncbi:MAG: T9SS type A sorting domain-containing protein [Bacteroidales bacterium]
MKKLLQLLFMVSFFCITNIGKTECKPELLWENKIISSNEEENSQFYFINQENLILDLYPNPAQKKVTIKLTASNKSTAKYAKVSILNLVGERVFFKKIMRERNLIRISNLNLKPGIYFVKLKLNNTFDIRKILIK